MLSTAMSEKLVGVSAACTALVLPATVVHVITMSFPCGRIDRILNTDALSAGSVPARNSFVLLMPSPSGSAGGAGLGEVVETEKIIFPKREGVGRLGGGL